MWRGADAFGEDIYATLKGAGERGDFERVATNRIHFGPRTRLQRQSLPRGPK